MRTNLSRYSLLVCLAAGLVASGCSSAIQGGVDNAPVVIFSNQSLDATTVYAARPGGDPRRLTSVMPGRTETLTLPADIASASTVTILAGSASGTIAASTGMISVSPGTRLAITLNPTGNALSVLPAGPPQR